MKNKFKLMPVAAALALGLSVSPAHASIWDDISNWVNNAVSTIENSLIEGVDWASDAAADAADWTQDAGAWAADNTNTFGNDLASNGDYVIKFSESATTTAISAIETGANIAISTIEDIASDVYQDVILAIIQPVKNDVIEPLESLGRAWKGAYALNPKNFSGLAKGVTSNNGPMINYYLNKVFMDIGSGLLGSIVEDFNNKGMGSLLVMFTVSGGTGAFGAETTTGLAIDIDYVAHFINSIGSASSFEEFMSNANYVNAVQGFSGPVASLFFAGGLDLGVTGGASMDVTIGYHTANPDGVDGLGLDVGLSVASPKGGLGVSFGLDASNSNLPVVTGAISLSGGARVEVAIGPSYAVIIGQLCGTGVFKSGWDSCPPPSQVDEEYDTADDNFITIMPPELVMVIM